MAHLPRVKKLLLEFSLLLSFSISHVCAAVMFGTNGSLLLLLLSLGTAGVGFWFCCQRFCQVNAALAALRSYALYQSRMLEQLATTAKGAEGSLVFNARTEPKSRWEP